MSSNQEVSKRKLNSSNSNRSSVETIKKEQLSSSIFQSDSLIQSIISGYKARTSAECKSIDAFLAFTVCTGMAQLVYCSATGGFPYNAFIGVFAASIGSFVFAGTKLKLKSVSFITFIFNSKCSFTM